MALPPLARPTGALNRRHALNALAASALVVPSATSAAARTVLLARAHFRGESDGGLPQALLTEALQLGPGEPWRVKPTPHMTNERARRDLLSGVVGVDTLVDMPNPVYERSLRLVPYPLFRGLYGWRVLVVRRGEALRVANAFERGQSKRLRLVQGESWADTEILRRNGYAVLTGQHTDAMYERLAAGQADAFPRGVTEVGRELAADAQAQGARFEVVPGVALHYRADLCFYVAPRDTELAERLGAGLMALHANGRHDALMRQFHGADLARWQRSSRWTVELSHDGMPAALREQPAALWTPPAP